MCIVAIVARALLLDVVILIALCQYRNTFWAVNCDVTCLLILNIVSIPKP